jgi:uncharacterized membrane protein
MKTLSTLAAVVVTILVLDLTFLGVVAKPFYDATMGPLRAPEVNVVAAALFYALYVGAILRHAVGRASSVKDAARAGAEMGLLAYGTYELTNWAVLSGWPAVLVPVDMLWGVVLTAAASAVGKAVSQRFS